MSKQVVHVYDATKGKTFSYTTKKKKVTVPHGNACAGKIQHKSELAAQQHAEDLQKKSKEKVEYYKCGRCGWFHVGRKKPKGNERKDVKGKIKGST